MSTSEPIHYDIAIAGGGMVGMSMAIAAARLGLRVAVIERTPISSQLEAGFDGRVSAIALGSVRILEHIGVWGLLAPHAQPIDDIRVTDGDTPFFLHYDHHDVGTEPFGYIAENRYIRHALHQVAATLPTLTIIDRTTVSSLVQQPHSSQLVLSNGQCLQVRLAMAADGKHSSLRKLCGIDDITINYDQTAIVTTIAHTASHHNLAQERFLPAGPFAVLPMTQNRSSLVWVEPNDRISSYMELPDDEFLQEIAERTGNYLGGLSLASSRFTYPLVLMHAKRYHAGRVVLIGDAAHGIHPIAGQGVNLGFRDVGVLEELLAQSHSLGLDIGSETLLNQYGQWRRIDNLTMLAVTDLLTRVFSTNFLAVKAARDLGLWAVGKIPPLKRFFMRHAMGMVGDLPRSVKRH
jgi:2-octaprenyl-6-methoxyphenol hydroxylase